MRVFSTEEEFKEFHNYELLNPLMRQYLDIKATCQDSLLLFRLGDFYELFFEDAKLASSMLNLVLTSRAKGSEGVEIPMCGIPHHALENYLYKIIAEGYTVALCEQVESPIDAKKRGGSKALVKREIARIFTPGTVIEESIVNAYLPNYLVSVVLSNDFCTLCCVDVGACEIGVFDLQIFDLASELEKLQPKELIVSKKDLENSFLQKALLPLGKRLLVQDDSWFSLQKASRVLRNFYGIESIDSIGRLTKSQIQSVGGVLEYLNITQRSKSALPLPQVINTSDFMMVDLATQRNLEINVPGPDSGASLFSVLNNTLTKAGSRLLYRYLKNPLASAERINERLEITSFFRDCHELLNKVRSYLNLAEDLERALARISMQRFALQDFLTVKTCINIGAKVKESITKQFGFDIPALLGRVMEDICDLSELYHEISSAIKPQDLPINLNEGGFINSSYHHGLSEINAALEKTLDGQNRLRLKYAESSGIENLKIQQNNIIGFFVEVSQKQAHKLDSKTFLHKQTTLNSVRFVTPELLELERNFKDAKHRAVALEHEILQSVASKIKENSDNLRLLGGAIAMLDVFCSFAFCAKEYNYVMPRVSSDGPTIVRQGRHPVVERVLRKNSGHFVPNDCEFNQTQNIWLITGPNMGGKSTFMRQNALIVLMAQIGSFVPAEYAEIRVVDKLFCRIGANDAIAKGQSTFMVEMCETASILSQATARSFVILDEVGRGTSTYDGISIAAACLEYIAKRIKSRCLFATHYHELTQLSEVLSAVANCTLSIKEEDGQISFLYKICPGVADKSYGLHVAQIAGLPKEVLDRSGEILTRLEEQHNKISLY